MTPRPSTALAAALALSGSLLLTACGGSDEAPAPEPTGNSMIQVSVPEVVGLEETAARKAIADAGLKVGEVTEAHDAKAPAGEVAQQTPDPTKGDTATPGSAVDLVISLGPEK